MLGNWERFSSGTMQHWLQYFFSDSSSAHIPSPSGRLFPSHSLFPPIMCLTLPKPGERKGVNGKELLVRRHELPFQEHRKHHLKPSLSGVLHLH